MKTQLMQTQNHVLSQQMQLSAKILQMGSLELSQYVQELALENPVVELGQEELRWDHMDKSSASMPSHGDDDPAEWASFRESGRQNRATREKDWGITQPDVLDYVPEKGESLYEHLLYQLMGMKLPKRQRQIMTHLIWNLNEDGYLTISEEELSESLEISQGDVKWGVKVLQSMEPPGIGARNLRECLLLQVSRCANRETEDHILRNEKRGFDSATDEKHHENLHDFDRIVGDLILNYLPLLAAKKFQQIGKALGVSVKQVQEAHRTICRFNPKPGNGFSSHQPVQMITPDIFVTYHHDKLEVFLNQECQPAIHICEYYRKLAAREDMDQELQIYMTEKMRQARWIMKCIEQRKYTLKRCAEAIVRTQSSFFTSGCKSLKPMTLADLAFELEISESTVSRTMKNKYLKCEYGIFPMSTFLSGEVGKNTGQTQSSILQEMKSIITEEDAAAPLSDQAIAETLSAKGIEISRRTVAKYRDLLRIPSAFIRKREYLENPVNIESCHL